MKIDIMNPPDWDALWEEAVIPDGRNDEWRRVLAYRTKLPDDAVRLAAQGWTPELVVAAREIPWLYFTDDDSPEAHKHYPEGVDVPASTAAKLLLADETAKWHEAQMRLAREVRWLRIRELADARGWSHQAIGDLIGLTRQRIRAIVRSNNIAGMHKQ